MYRRCTPADIARLFVEIAEEMEADADPILTAYAARLTALAGKADEWLGGLTPALVERIEDEISEEGLAGRWGESLTENFMARLEDIAAA